MSSATMKPIFLADDAKGKLATATLVMMGSPIVGGLFCSLMQKDSFCFHVIQLLFFVPPINCVSSALTDDNQNDAENRINRLSPKNEFGQCRRLMAQVTDDHQHTMSSFSHTEITL